MKTITSQTTILIEEATLCHPLDQCIFFDIETTGLSPRASSLYQIGIMIYDNAAHCWNITQWFANKHRDEEPIIRLFLETLQQYNYLYHFNGRTFDIPYLLSKAEKYHIELSDHASMILHDTTATWSVDLLAQIRPLKKILGIPKAGQTDLERWIGRNRQDTYSGGDLIPIYSQYMQDQLLHPEQAQESEQLLLLHNHDDMEGMLAISQMLHYRHLFDMIPAIENQLEITEITMQQPQNAADPCHVTLHFRHHAALPKAVSLTGYYPATKDTEAGFSLDSCHLNLDIDTGCLLIPIITAELKYFLPDPKDYYYLPSEDQAVHKSIAEFVEPSHRKKATAATCYVRKQGQFIPSMQPYKANSAAILSETPTLLSIYRDKLGFYELPSTLTPQNDFWKKYLAETLKAWQ